MRDGARQVWKLCLDNLDEVVVCVTLMQEHGQPRVPRNSKLSTECIELRVARREIAKIIETALADGNNSFPRCEPANQRIAGIVVGGCVVGVNARRGVEDAGICRGEFSRSYIAVIAASSDDHRSHAGLCGPPHDCLAVFVEAVVRQVGANVDQVHVSIAPSGIWQRLFPEKRRSGRARLRGSAQHR